MGITQSYAFDNAENFSLSNVSLENGKAKLAVINNPGKSFLQSFGSSSGFTFEDVAKAEVLSGVLRQRNQLGDNVSLGVSFATNFTQLFPSSGITQSLNTVGGSPTIAGGKVDCTGNQSVYYDGNPIGSVSSQGAMKFKFTPNYTGSPGLNVDIVALKEVSANNNKLSLFQRTNGHLSVIVYDSSGTLVANQVSIGLWSPVSGTEYEFEINFDSTTGSVRLFIDGLIHGSLTLSAWTRTSSAVRLVIGSDVGSNLYCNGKFREVILYTQVQHTIAYESGYSFPAFLYVATNATLPTFLYGDVGSVQSLSGFAAVVTGSPRFVIDGKYWNGNAWANSDLTYDQANDVDTINTNLASFSMANYNEISVMAFFPESNTLSSVDDLSIGYTGQRYSPTGYVEPSLPIYVKSILGYMHDVIETVDAEMKVCIKIDGVLKYHDGNDWVDSDGSFAQSNTEFEIDAFAGDLPILKNSTVYIRWVFKTDAEFETPELESADIEYDFGAIETKALSCIVFGFLKNIANQPIQGASIKFELNIKADRYKEANNNIVSTEPVTVVTDVNGYFSLPLIRSSEYEGPTTYLVTISKNGKVIKKNGQGKITLTVPDADTKDFTEQISE